jgi:hypothetical protein
MSVAELPDEQLVSFNQWFEKLPPNIRLFYRKPSLQNVLDTHTNKLYEQASTYFAGKTGKNISDEDAKFIIKTAFICLTKIDQGRAVRNRMTLQEVTNILGIPECGTGDVGTILNIFREPGNTFIRPFLLDNEESRNLDDNTILDITHESLIRNWEYLGQWAKEEFDNYNISLDFEQQVNRWVGSGKSKAFLLSIGPLTFFENWFNAKQPNASWIARYLPEEMDDGKKLSKASQVLVNMQEFLSQSARRHVVTRTVVRYGAKRIALALALVAIIILSSFAVSDYVRRKNNYVLKSIRDQSFEIANRQKLSLMYAVPALTQEMIMGNVTISEAVDAVKEPLQKITIATGIATQLITQGRNEPREEIMQSLVLADSLLQRLQIPADGRGLSEGLKLIHDYEVTVGFGYFFSPDDSIKTLVMHNSQMAAKWAMRVFEKQPADFDDIQSLSLALDNGLNHDVFNADQINHILNIISPVENHQRTAWVERNYAKNIRLLRGSNDYGAPFNGLYQDLAYLYAATGQSAKVLECMDSILAYQQNFYQNDYATHAENATNVAAIFYTYGTTASLDEFVSGYCNRKKISPEEFYNRLVARAMMEFTLRLSTNFYAGGTGRSTHNLNLKFSSDQMLSFFFQKLQEETVKITDPTERNFNLAVCLKNEGVLFAYRNEIRNEHNIKTDKFFDDAIANYQKVPEEYRDQMINVAGTLGPTEIAVPRKFLFLYPDFRVSFDPVEPRVPPLFYNSPAFLRYLLDHNLFNDLYATNDDFRFFEPWELDYHLNMSSKNFFMCDDIPDSTFVELNNKLGARNANRSADLNIFYLHLADNAFNRNDSINGVKYLEQIQTDKLLNAFQYKLFGAFANTYSLELVASAIANLTVHNHFDLAYQLLNVFQNRINRSSLYGYASQLVSIHQQSPAAANRLLDSARVEMNRLENPALFQPNRCQVAIAMMYIDPVKNQADAYHTIKNSTDKYQAIPFFSKAFALKGNLYGAEQQVPSLVSMGDKGLFLYQITNGFNLAQPQTDRWRKFNKDEFLFTRLYLPYINEN